MVRPILATAALLAAAAAAAAAGKKYQIFDKQSFTVPKNVHSVSFSRDGKRVVVGEDNVHVYDISGPKPTPVAELPTGVFGGVHAVAFSPDGKYVYVGGTSGGIAVWDISASPPERANRYKVHASLVSGMSVTADGSHLVSSSHDGTAIVWRVGADGSLTERTVTPKPITGSHKATGVAAVPNTDKLVVVTTDGHYRVFDYSAGSAKMKGNRKLTGGGEAVVAAGYGGTNKIAAFGMNDRLFVYPSKYVSKFPNRIVGVGYTPDGLVLTAAGQDGRVIAYATNRMKPLFLETRPERLTCLATLPRAATTKPGEDTAVAVGAIGGKVTVLRMGLR